MLQRVLVLQLLPRFPSFEELPPPEAPVEQSQRRIGAPMSMTSFEPLSESEISSLLPLIGNTIDYITTSTTLSDVSVEESIDMTVTSDKASTLVDQVLVEQNSCETGNGNPITANGINDVLKEVAPISQPPSPAIQNVHPFPIPIHWVTMTELPSSLPIVTLLLHLLHFRFLLPVGVTAQTKISWLILDQANGIDRS